MLKRLLRTETGREVASRLLAGLIRLLACTIRWQTLNPEIRDRALGSDQPAIGAFWHNRIMLMTEIWPRGRPMAMLQSKHPDGRLIARTIQHLGIDDIVGSAGKGKGGAQAIRAMLRALKNGSSVAITPDGPRGPRMRVSDGIIALARMSGAPIYPVTWNVSRRRVLRSWDRFILALPFSRGIFVWGPPIHVPRDADAETQERLRLELETRLNQLCEEADRALGTEPIRPADTEPAAA
ncbi:lysophospholipid acyltransferase family protein [Nisaea acidiphila]|uniref:Lysophospholipid acyltransferase family protein n=1 Tax=Nisaea acidiphila TaxID=1862145 RepID=A0A9J7AM47_9PROT|nr:lysophospholipid acyltransferase family protein [Nisaea acidiphila]UUX48239.1 lysophospholipid acyltransferase family protein [Nisaea acidiphila]